MQTTMKKNIYVAFGGVFSLEQEEELRDIFSEIFKHDFTTQEFLIILEKFETNLKVRKPSVRYKWHLGCRYIKFTLNQWAEFMFYVIAEGILSNSYLKIVNIQKGEKPSEIKLIKMG